MNHRELQQQQQQQQQDFSWLLRASEIMRELWWTVSTAQKEKEEMIAEVFAMAAALYPKFAMCSPDEKDWRVAAQVILQWRVQCLPHWFIDLFFQCPHDQVPAMRAELLRNIKNNIGGIGRDHTFWTELLALVPAEEEKEVNHADARAVPFFRLLVAFRDSGCSELAQYWNTTYCRAHSSRYFLTGTDLYSWFNRLVLPWKSLECLNLVLDQLKREKCGTAGVAQSLFASNWRAGVAQLMLEHLDYSGSLRAATFPLHAVTPASHPAILDWVLCNTFDAFAGMAVSRKTKLHSGFVKWIVNSFDAMFEFGTLGFIHAEMGPMRAFRALRFMLSGHCTTSNPRLLNAVARQLRVSLDDAVAAQSAAKDDGKDEDEEEVEGGGGGAKNADKSGRMRIGSIQVLTWWLMTDPSAPTWATCVGQSSEWSLRFEALRFADLLRWPPLDGKMTAQLFADHLLATAPFMVVETRMEATSKEIEDEEAKHGTWLSGASVAHLRMALMVLREFGWFKRAEDLRSLAVRLAGEGVHRSNRCCRLAVTVEEFLAMVDDGGAEDATKATVRFF